MPTPPEVRTDVLRVGRIDYLNSLPFCFQFGRQEATVQWEKGLPMVLNERMRESRLDVSLISSLEYAHSPERYLILDKVCIGIKQQSDSVILVSKKEIEELQAARLTIPRESLSSAALLMVLLRQRFDYENEFVPGSNGVEEILDQADGGLLIGDPALFEKHKAPYHYDLGTLWREWKQKPFCFALWAVRREAAEQFPGQVESFHRELVQTLQYNLYHLEEAAENLEKEYGLDEDRVRLALNYFTRLNYWLDKEMEEGLLEFYRCAQSLGLAPACPNLEYFKR